MAWFQTLNSLRRETISLALQTLGLQPRKGRTSRTRGKAGLYRTYGPEATRRSTAAVDAPHQPAALQVLQVQRETADAVSITLADPQGRPMVFKPGMFFTVVVTMDGQEYRRAYSVCSAANDSSTVTIAVKRVADGKVSNWLNDHLSAGNTLRVLGPSGNFVLEPQSGAQRQLLLVGGGSGITPLMSMARTVLAQEPQSRVYLLYGNRGLDDVIFLGALRALKKQHANRLTLVHVLEHPPKGWRGKKGRLDRAMFAGLLDTILTSAALADLEVYTCGPAPLMQGVREELAARGLPAARFHQEVFTPAVGTVDSTRFSAQSVQVDAGGQRWSGIAQAGQTLLEAGLASGAPMQFSCTLGGCGRCRVKILEGAVDMPEPNCLMPDEKAQHYALACIARPLTQVQCAIEPPQAH